MQFAIRIVTEDGDPCEGVKVSVNYGLLYGFEDAYTDDDGWASFSPSRDDYDSCTVYLDGANYGDISISDGSTHSFVRG